MARTTQASVSQKRKDVVVARKVLKKSDAVASAAPAVASGDVKKKKRRFRPGVQATREIFRQQKETKNVLARAPFVRLAREVGQQIDPELRFSKISLDALQVASEHYLLDVFQRAQFATVQVPNTDAAVSLTLRPNAMKLAKYWVDEVRRGGCDPRSVLTADRTAVVNVPNKRKSKAPVKKSTKKTDDAPTVPAAEPAAEKNEEAKADETDVSDN